MVEKKEKSIDLATPEKQLEAFLVSSKEDHYNFEPDHDYKVPCSSLLLTSVLHGGLGPGAHRFVGLTAGGKSSCALDFMYHFLKDTSGGRRRRAVYIKSEGRLSKQMQERSGVDFVKSPTEWVDGTCFIFESNIYESVFRLKRSLISDNPNNIEYFFCTDSADSLIKREDAQKTEEESVTVSGGALITSTFLKKVGLAMEKRGHIDIYISQIRDEIKINKYEITIPKQGRASGGRALEHQANNVLEFLPRFKADLILEGDKGSKILGHFCKCKVLKGDNENAFIEVAYPIRYNQKNGQSVWSSYELADLLILWEFLVKAGAWFSFNDSFKEELQKEFSKEIPERIQGINNLRLWLEESPDIQEYLFNKFKNLSI